MLLSKIPQCQQLIGETVNRKFAWDLNKSLLDYIKTAPL